MKIVISGSMSFYDDMQKYADILQKRGLEVVIPEEDDWDSIPASEIMEYKKQVSIKHFDEIASQSTDAILVLNQRKKDIDNYIGANTFAEIAIAFYFKKKIYILNGYYEPYNDELEGWGAIPLNGNINNML